MRLRDYGFDWSLRNSLVDELGRRSGVAVLAAVLRQQTTLRGLARASTHRGQETVTSGAPCWRCGTIAAFLKTLLASVTKLLATSIDESTHFRATVSTR
jgi:hypothetical protein